ncbi:MAG: YeeE/YedE thiosulfate transporter family protein [Victivallaceae bacterium]|nr:YeeE/YedE thiosulfate transporter family protein [Victivallaceae bacterium]
MPVEFSPKSVIIIKRQQIYGLDMRILTGKWSFYLNGALLSGMIVLCLYLFKDTVGMNDGMIKISEYVEKTVQEEEITLPPLEWQTGFLGGIFIGALAASLMSGNWKIRLFQEGESGLITKSLKTVLYGIGGGFLVMLGLQLAGDSFLGQWSGALQLAGGAWIFLTSSFAVASGMAILLERRGESEGE